MRYIAAKTNIIDPSIDSAEWGRAEEGHIAAERWQGYSPVPATTFRLLRGPEGISVLFTTAERGLRAECKEENSMVCTDSCMEFFFKPDPWDTRYINLEMNPRGVMYLSIGSGRHGRELLDTDRRIFNIETIPAEGNWRLKLYIPDSFLLSHFECIAPVCRGNFYKCGDLTGHEHYGMWSEAEVPSPDFHVPDFFGIIEL